MGRHRLLLSLVGPFQATLDGQPATGFESNKACIHATPRANCVLTFSLLFLPTTNGRDLSGNCHFLTTLSFGYTG